MATISVAKYLWTRVHQVGTRSIMGLPGDFNMNFLDAIYGVPGLEFGMFGNSNELNASYAADGYARVKGAPACLVTTHGVGELSAINGIAGSRSEHVPVIHVVGQTARSLQDAHAMIHHGIGTRPDHQIYNKVSQPLRCAVAELWEPSKAPAAIDHAVRECIIQCKPVYIYFPIDLTAEQVDASLLTTPIDLTIPTNQENEDAAVTATAQALHSSKNASLFIDYLVHSHGRSQAQRLADHLDLPIYASHMAKGAVDETHPRFVGLYNAFVSFEGIAAAIEACDLWLCLGWWCANTNSVFFNRKMPVEKRVDVLDDHVIVQGHLFSNVFMAPFLDRLAKAISSTSIAKPPMPKVGDQHHTPDQEDPQITQSWIWKRLGRFFREGDVVLADTGTASMGLPDAKFPANVKYIAQTYYGSIGYATGAALGADLALREMQQESDSTTRPRGRTVLVTGDGSFQLAMQELGTMVARNLPIVVIIINNNGYTIERAIHGAKQPYNTIIPTDYAALLPLFKHPSPARSYRRATTKHDVNKTLDDPALNLANPETLKLIELVLDKLDIPWRMARMLGARQKDYLVEQGFSNMDY